VHEDTETGPLRNPGLPGGGRPRADGCVASAVRAPGLRYGRRMRQRILLLFGTLYVGAALIGHAKERGGAMTCECQDACWCKRPGIRLFRWVLPLGHKLR